MQDNPLALPGRIKGVPHEKIFEQEVKRLLTLELACNVEKLHGSAFQTGLPDLLVLHNARLLLIELKWTHGRIASVGEIFIQLQGRQKGLITLWGGKGAPIWILTGIKIGQETRTYLTSAMDRRWDEKPRGPLPLRAALEALLRGRDSWSSSAAQSSAT